MGVGLLGRKLGMTQIFDDEGRAVPVTVIQAGPCVVVQTRTKERDGYRAVQLGFGEIKPRKVNKPMAGHFRKAGVEPVRVLREFRVDDDEPLPEVGQQVTVDLFKAGEYVDVTGTSKGKGFLGPIARHGFGRGPMSHGSKYHRGPGSLGPSTDPARVFKGRKMAGRAGHQRVTVRGLQVVRVDPERNLLLVKGAVPGPRGGLVAIRKTNVPRKARLA
ncbi:MULTISPECIES: 50S ribosomal protein L3 [Thermaerobacter]|uniref:Large ribosomal subunit protein uL3 n=1 Tax=Thermaerobacter composti TaxID=554949 RepID=A0ABZ0QR68_9FIRM|nr:MULTISPECIES: 50S ribosomal protein L3 [Thermaerobacter]PZN09397.1 MAG: 50S ribosomal protein L3 [Bacillota bacterium]QBS37032.1 50S ribosomal protein L3 [Thermaerobacter sp. FW80]WPD19042.1 50S ribosomal protein L3 [Thermaerobacter composti]